MAEFVNRTENLNFARADWGAIWAGVFSFLAIWSVFGLLGIAVFASAANPNAAQPTSGVSAGFGIWTIVLTIIAMYVAGRETGRLAAVTNRHDGLVHGMIMFGLSIGLVILVSALGGAAMNNPASRPTNAYMLNALSGMGWFGFVSLFLGWLAAMGGASTGSGQNVEKASNVRGIRTAA